MSNFVYPNVGNNITGGREQFFLGLGIYPKIYDYTGSSYIQHDKKDYSVSVAALKHVHLARRVAYLLCPELEDNETQIYELIPKDVDVQGESRGLAYFLTLVGQQKTLQSIFKQIEDIWCTGSIEKAEDIFFLKPVHELSFELKLQSFLNAQEHNDTASLFIVPATNMPPNLMAMCLEAGANVISVSKALNSGKASVSKKTILKVSELYDLVEYLFIDNSLKSNDTYEINPNKKKIIETPEMLKTELISLLKKIKSNSLHEPKCHIEIQPLESAKSISRDMTFSDASSHAGFTLDSKINIGYYYTGLDGPVEITIFDIGTTGKLTVLMPNDPIAENKINWFPYAYRDQSITLTGITGIENVFVIATLKKKEIRQSLNLNRENLAQEITGQDAIIKLTKLAEILSALPTNSWAIGDFEFQIKS